jgi:hypothetical protein
VEFALPVSPPIKRRRQDLQACEPVISSPSSHGGVGRSLCCSCSLSRSRWCIQAAASSSSLRGGQVRHRAQLPQGRPGQAPRWRSCSTSCVEALSEPCVGDPVFLPSSGSSPMASRRPMCGAPRRWRRQRTRSRFLFLSKVLCVNLQALYFLFCLDKGLSIRCTHRF